MAHFRPDLQKLALTPVHDYVSARPPFAADIRRAFADLAPAGYFVALRIGFLFPQVEVNALPAGWVERYNREGYMPQDPLIRWLHAGEGVVRWSETGLDDPRGVLADAARQGLRFGLAVALVEDGADPRRSLGTFARSDREYTDAEMAEVRARFAALAAAARPPAALTQAEAEALSMVRDGLLIKEIAVILGVTEGAIKQRLKGARLKLRAKTGSHAVSVAAATGLI